MGARGRGGEWKKQVSVVRARGEAGGVGERAREGEGGWEKGEEVGGLHIAAEEGDAVSSSLLLGFFLFFLFSSFRLAPPL